MFKFDFTITIGDVLAVLGVCATIGTSALAVVRKLDKFLVLLKEYPPHRHTPAGEIVFPKGMSPEPVESDRAQTRAAAAS